MWYFGIRSVFWLFKQSLSPLEKRTLVFDLDETLVHCNESVEKPSDVVLPIKFPSGETIKVSKKTLSFRSSWELKFNALCIELGWDKHQALRSGVSQGAQPNIRNRHLHCLALVLCECGLGLFGPESRVDFSQTLQGALRSDGRGDVHQGLESH